MEMGGAKLKDFTLKQKIITFTNQCIFIEGWMEFECQVLSLTFSQGACSQDCIFLMKMVQAGSLISEMELLWYCFTLQMGCVVLKGCFFLSQPFFMDTIFCLSYSILLSLRHQLDCFWPASIEVSFWPLGRRFFFFFWLALRKIGKSFTPHRLLFALSRVDALPVCNSVMSVSEIKEKASF